MLEIQSLTEADIDDALGLSTQAGWNQVAADWKRLLKLCPDSCFAGMVDGELVATTTVITYGDDVSWIGMVLVEEDHRGQGYGTQIFEHGLEQALEHGGKIIGLDATTQGAQIYRKYGFQQVAPVSRWQGTVEAPAGQNDGDIIDDIESFDQSDLDAVCSFDRDQIGIDRRGLIEEVLAEPETAGVISRGSSGIDGYAIARPGRQAWQVGPIISTGERNIGPLLLAASHEVGKYEVIVDAPEREKVTSKLEKVGLERVRKLTRMTRPEQAPALFSDSVRAFADFAFG